jgi:hypothetical protein
MSLFEFNQEDLSEAVPYVRDKLYAKTKQMKWRLMTQEELLLELPLSTWKRSVRRVYLQPDQQLRNLAAWWKEFIDTPTVFVALVNGKAKPLVRGGAEGLEKFKKVMASQLGLVQQGMLSGEWELCHCAALCVCTAGKSQLLLWCHVQAAAVHLMWTCPACKHDTAASSF